MNLAVARLQQIFSLSSYFCDYEKDEGVGFSQILIVSLCHTSMYLLLLIELQDLSHYQNDELLHESLHLLGRIYSAEENLFEKAIQSQVNI